MTAIDAEPIKTDVLIVGAGPTGAALACFLASHGIKGIIISKDEATCSTSRASYMNKAAIECLRDIGLEDDAVANGVLMKDCAVYHRICHSLAGEEILRMTSLGNDPKEMGAYEAASPSPSINLPQQNLEPMLLTHANTHGFITRFSSELLSFHNIQGAYSVRSVVKDLFTGETLTIDSKFLCGADGASSVVAKSLDLPFQFQPQAATFVHVEIEADLSHLMRGTPAIIQLLIRPDKPQLLWAMMGILRSSVPWKKWTVSLACHPSLADQRIQVTPDEMMARIRELIGDDQVPMKYVQHTFWRVRERYAEKYSVGNVFCLGDAVHQHPPHNGLGANTCIQDSFNLAWKLAYVLQGKANASLLDSYSAERQPIGQWVVKRANATAKIIGGFGGVLGLTGSDGDTRMEAHRRLADDSEEGEKARTDLRAVRHALAEDGGLGGEMNQWYQSNAVYAVDEHESDKPHWPSDMRSRTLNYIESSFPGFRVPHVWVTARKTLPGSSPPPTSTRDLCGHGLLTILTGVGGKTLWNSAAQAVLEKLNLEIRLYSIGPGQDYEDTFNEWYEKRGVEEHGAILVRPDRTVAWRSKDVSTSDIASGKLLLVVSKILGLQ